MVAPLGPLWKYYHMGIRQNTAHKKAYCLFCIAARRPDNIPIDVDEVAGINKETAQKKQWFKDILSAMEAEDAAGCIRGTRDPMISHLVGRNACKLASSAAKKEARKLKNGDNPAESDNDASNESDDPPSRKRPRTTKIHTKVNAHVQATLKTYKGVDVPFSEPQITAIKRQFARATVSAKLPYTWVEDPEIIALFLLPRSRASDAMPSRHVLSNRLIDEESQYTEKILEKAITGKDTTLTTDVCDLASFAIMLLNLACNQAGNERVFSQLLVQQTRLRNRLGLEKLEKMTKIGAQLRAEHYEANLREPSCRCGW
ncbi:hypothetical protein AURDEDRAFT_121926 [Auricularia subglabra TFB-10046 SS5]|nr:hypothetical protein AURDEDRAFT_121926 [Auricularia subglabra TFB-10046 SS5]